MTQDEIIEMAQECGLVGMRPHLDGIYVESLFAFAKLVAEKALAQPKEEKLHPIHIGVDVTKEGTTVTAFYRKPDAVMEMFYSQFHPMAQPEQEPHTA